MLLQVLSEYLLLMACWTCAQAACGEILEGIHAAVHTVVDQLDSLAVSSAAGELAVTLMPALEQMLSCVCGNPAADDCKDSAGIWVCLADLFCSPDGRSAQVCLLVILLHTCPCGWVSNILPFGT